MKLRTINRIIEWTGFVLVVGVDDGTGPTRAPTTLRIVFVGWPPAKAWARYCERSKAKRVEVTDGS